MTQPLLKVKLNGAGQGTISLDGKELTNVSAIDFQARVGEANRVTLEFVGCDIEVEGLVDVTTLSSYSREFAPRRSWFQRLFRSRRKIPS